MSTALIPSPAYTEREFGTVFAKLALQLRWTDADEVAIRSYFEALRGLPLEAIRTAAQGFAQEPGRKWFPTTGEWLQAAQAATAQAFRETVPHRAQPWRLECEECEDTGWILGLECDGGAQQWPEAIPHEVRGKQGPEWRQEQKVGWKGQTRGTPTPQSSTCGRGKPHLPHTYTKPCFCRATNRTYQRTQQFGKGA